MALLPASPAGTTLWHDKDRLERTDFMGAIIKFGDWDTLTALFESLAREDYPALQGVAADLIAFYCQVCGRVYCEQCWTIGPPVFDEGFYDYTAGTCPAGHEQTVDD